MECPTAAAAGTAASIFRDVFKGNEMKEFQSVQVGCWGERCGGEKSSGLQVFSFHKLMSPNYRSIPSPPAKSSPTQEGTLPATKITEKQHQSSMVKRKGHDFWASSLVPKVRCFKPLLEEKLMENAKVKPRIGRFRNSLDDVY